MLSGSANPQKAPRAQGMLSTTLHTLINTTAGNEKRTATRNSRHRPIAITKQAKAFPEAVN